MVTFTGRTVMIEETNESCKVQSVRVLEFIKKVVEHYENDAKHHAHKRYDQGVRDGVEKCKIRVCNALKGI